jgi:hypothetical protein
LPLAGESNIVRPGDKSGDIPQSCHVKLGLLQREFFQPIRNMLAKGCSPNARMAFSRSMPRRAWQVNCFA